MEPICGFGDHSGQIRSTRADLNAVIEVEFLAPVSGSFDVHYDGYKFGECPGSVYSDTPDGIRFDGWPHWHRVSLEMSNARLDG